jgi:hypothetical protein
MFFILITKFLGAFETYDSHIIQYISRFQGVTINIHQSSTQLWAKIRFLPHHCSTPRAEHLTLRKTQEVKHVRVRLTPDVAYNPEISDNI